MKKTIAFFVGILVVLAGVQGAAFVETVESVPLYRMYGHSHHFYTTNNAERDSAIQNAGYKDEGIAGHVFPKKVPGTVALYRFASERPAGGGTRHFYTINNAAGIAAAKDGYKPEGICCYVSEKKENGALPFHRLYLAFQPHSNKDFVNANEWGDDHLYTTDDKEKFDAINKFKFISEGYEGCIWKTQVAFPFVTFLKMGKMKSN